MSKKIKKATGKSSLINTFVNWSRHNKKRIIFIFWILIFLIVLNLFTGVLSYGFMTVRCGHLPITASTFASDYHYYTPGQSGYGPSMFHNAYFCSTEEAEKAGFNAY